MEAQLRGADLVGRERECTALDTLLRAAAAGESGSLVIRGEAGIGKTALLEHAARHAQDMTVLRTTGFQSDADLAFAGLYGLVRPILGHLDEVPATQAEALAGALGLAPSAGSDRFLVSAAVLGLLAAAADTRPVLCIVDDAQWLDRPSADALVFAARRLRADRVAMLFGAREGDTRRFSAPGLDEIELGGLDEITASAVLDKRAGSAPAAVKARLLADAHGNPLALMELPSGLTDEQLAGTDPLPEALPLTPRLQALFRDRIAGLPPDAQTLLLLACADDTRDLTTLQRAAAELRLDADAFEPAEDGGLIEVSNGVVTFRHPLVRTAVYDSAPVTRRRGVHAALARVLDGEEHADRRVWHQAMATLAPDEEVATALDASARRARMRGAHASAASAFARAAELSTDAERRVQRLAAAAQAAWDAGDPGSARTRIARVLPSATGEVRAQLLRLRGLIEARAGALRAAHDAFVGAAETTNDPSLKLEVLAEAAEAASFAGDFAELGSLGELVAEVEPASERDRFNLAVFSGFASLYRGDQEQAHAGFADALRRADDLEDPGALIWASNAASAAGGWGAGLPYATRAVRLARERGLLSVLPRALERQGGEFLWNSRLDLALTAASEAHALARDMGFESPWNRLTMATVAAIRGREEDARAHAEHVLATGGQMGGPFLVTSARFALAFIELSAGRWEQATDRLLAVTAAHGASAHPITARAAVPDLVEAAARAGRLEETEDALAAFRAWVATTSGEAGRALLARCEALLDERSGEAAFADAVGREAALSPFQAARTRLLYGEWLRRARRRVDARVQLRAALDAFRQLGAAPWEERAAAELRATGETARVRDPSTRDELTPQERQIAALVAEGLTNRDIAAQLYLSPRTIDYHLRKVFTKLGITSRAELIRDAPQTGERPR